MIKREQSLAITMGIKIESPRVSEGIRIIISQNVIICCFLKPGRDWMTKDALMVVINANAIPKTNSRK